MHQYNKEGTIISPREQGKTAASSLVKENLDLSTEMKTAGKMLLNSHTRLYHCIVYFMFLCIYRS